MSETNTLEYATPESAAPQEEDPAPARGSVGRETARGAMWLAGAGLGVQGLSFVSNIVVANHLFPSDYGAFAMAWVVLSLAGIFVAFGFGPAIVSGRMDDPKAIITSHWMICLIGLFLAALTFAVGRPVAAYFFHEPAVGKLLGVACLMLAINAWRVVPESLLRRDGKFNVVAIGAVVSQFFATIASIVMALMGTGAWALIAPAIVNALLGSGIAIAYSRLVIRREFHWDRVRPYFAECRHVIGTAINNFIFDSSDVVVVGKILGESALGQYNFAYNLVSKSLDIFSRTVSSPLMASIGPLRNHLDRLDRAVVRACLAIARVTFPIAAGGIVLAPVMIRALFRDRWQSTIPLVQIFFVLGALQSVGQISNPVWLALGRTRLVFYWGITTSSAVVGAFLVGALVPGASVMTVVLSYTLFSGLVLTPAMIWTTRKWCGIGLNGLLMGFLPILRDVAIMAGVVLIAEIVLGEARISPKITVLPLIGLGAITYAGCFRIASPIELSTVLSAMPQKIQKMASRILAISPA